MRSKYLFVFIVVLFNYLVLASSKKSEIILNFATSYWPPYEYIENGEEKGLAIEILKEIFTKTGIKYKLKWMPWSRVIFYALEGKVDGIFSVSYTVEREKFLFYPEEYLHKSKYVFFIRKGDLDRIKINSLDDIKNYKVGITRGYSYNKILWEKLKKYNNYIEVNSDEINFLKLAHNRIDLFVCDKSNGLFIIKKLNLYDKITFLPFILFEKNYFLAFSRKSKKIKKDIIDLYDNILSKFKKSVQYKQILEKYK